MCGIQNGASFLMPLGPLHRSVRLNLNRQKSLSAQGAEGQKEGYCHRIRAEGRKRQAEVNLNVEFRKKMFNNIPPRSHPKRQVVPL